jgi:hypothetical protein
VIPVLHLYTTSGCHLCEEAESLLRHQLTGFTLQPVEIADSVTLVEQYGLRIPVIAVQGIPGAELDWPFRAEDVADFLDAHLAD